MMEEIEIEGQFFGAKTGELIRRIPELEATVPKTDGEVRRDLFRDYAGSFGVDDY
jgi:hypothetical protein